MVRNGFVVVDYVVFIATILTSLGIGVFFAISGGKQQSTSEYLVGDRKLRIFPVALSLMVTFESSITMLGHPAEVYSYGVMAYIAVIGVLVALLLGTRTVVPLCHPLKIRSVNEYYELRYKGRAVRLLGLFLSVASNIFYLGIVLFAPGIALEAVTGFPYWLSVISVAAASVIYTSIGGIKAVVWTDVFQSLIMMVGMLAVMIKGTIDSGGVVNVIEINKEHDRLNFFDFNPDPTVRHTFWTLVFGTCTRWLPIVFSQSTVQRVSSVKTQSKATWVILLAIPAFFLVLTFVSVEGLIAYAYYTTTRCDPYQSKQISNANQILPYLVLDLFQNRPGLSGLFLASLFSGSLSTISSGLASLSTVTVEDFVSPYFKLSDRALTLAAKISVVIYSMISIGISFMVAKIPGPLSQIASSIIASFGGPASGLFLFSIFFPWATQNGALIGTISSIALSLWLSFGQSFSTTLPRTPLAPMPPVDQCVNFNETLLSNVTETTINTIPEGVDKFYSVSYLYVAVIGIIYVLIIGVTVSCIEGLPKSSEVDVRFVLPFFDQMFPFLPQVLRQKLYLGVPFEKRKQWLATIKKENGKRETTHLVLSSSELNFLSVESDEKEEKKL